MLILIIYALVPRLKTSVSTRVQGQIYFQILYEKHKYKLTETRRNLSVKLHGT
jgi:hypothetical protein